MPCRDCVESSNRRRAALAALLALTALSWGCSQEKSARLGEQLRMGPFTLRVTSVDAYTRGHQGVPFEVEVRVTCDGGNRFERMDFADTLSKKEKIYFSTSGGWRDRAWMLARGDDNRDFVLHANPPLDSKGFVLDIGNPYAKWDEPGRILVDLGR
jgi:hypothetical protein